MYKETLEILMEGLNGDPIKEIILKNQLEYHFTNKSEKNNNDISCAAVIVRRILDDFILGEIIGIQPISDKNNPTVIMNGETVPADVRKRHFQTAAPEITMKDLQYVSGLDLSAEINSALALELENEITAEFVNIILRHASKYKDSFSEDTSSEDMSEAIIAAAEEVDGNWAIVAPVDIALLHMSGNYNRAGTTRGDMMGGLVHVGVLNNNINIYCHLHADGNILIGKKEQGNEETPIVYAPETMLMIGESISLDGFGSKIPLYTSYSPEISVDAENKYRKIITNY